VITGGLEKKRAEKTIGSSLEANINVYLSQNRIDLLEETDLAEISITSSFNVFNLDKNKNFFNIEDIENVFVEITEATGQKCERCWKYSNNINKDNICDRCNSAIGK
jgi:isoleucyl-tRNA synthetase